MFIQPYHSPPLVRIVTDVAIKWKCVAQIGYFRSEKATLVTFRLFHWQRAAAFPEASASATPQADEESIPEPEPYAVTVFVSAEAIPPIVDIKIAPTKIYRFIGPPFLGQSVTFLINPARVSMRD